MSPNSEYSLPTGSLAPCESDCPFSRDFFIKTCSIRGMNDHTVSDCQTWTQTSFGSKLRRLLPQLRPRVQHHVPQGPQPRSSRFRSSRFDTGYIVIPKTISTIPTSSSSVGTSSSTSSSSSDPFVDPRGDIQINGQLPSELHPDFVKAMYIQNPDVFRPAVEQLAPSGVPMRVRQAQPDMRRQRLVESYGQQLERISHRNDPYERNETMSTACPDPPATPKYIALNPNRPVTPQWVRDYLQIYQRQIPSPSPIKPGLRYPRTIYDERQFCTWYRRGNSIFFSTQPGLGSPQWRTGGQNIFRQHRRRLTPSPPPKTLVDDIKPPVDTPWDPLPAGIPPAFTINDPDLLVDDSLSTTTFTREGCPSPSSPPSPFSEESTYPDSGDTIPSISSEDEAFLADEETSSLVVPFPCPPPPPNNTPQCTPPPEQQPGKSIQSRCWTWIRSWFT